MPEKAKKKYRLLAGRHVETGPDGELVTYQFTPGKKTFVESATDLVKALPNKFALEGAEEEAEAPGEAPPVVPEEVSGKDVTKDFPDAGKKGLAVFKQGRHFAVRTTDGTVPAEGLTKKKVEAFIESFKE